MEYLETLMGQLSNMQWSDYLDIAIIAVVIYNVLALVRNTGTMRIAGVVLALVLAAWLTEALDLYTISYFLNQFLAIGLLAVVILFQPELRRMLEHLGNLRWTKFLRIKGSETELDPVITQTVMACEIMSRERVGALIVFARDNRLDEYFKTGTPIDGQVSEQLIRNIFFPKASLHDGAMIIRDGRVAAAGCVLPLSSSNRLSADLGTRHRAGVGMSEASDAVVVIVSEETGAISVAVGGMLKRHLASQTLERMLKKELCPEEPDRKNSLVLQMKRRLQRKGKGEQENEE